MRIRWLAIWLLSSSVGFAETPGVVLRPSFLQSGPGSVPPYYRTSRVEAGQTVIVLGEEGDFYAVRPPPGSFSYVPRSAVRLVPGESGVGVVNESVMTLVGSQLGPDATSHGVRLAPGTLVRLLGEERVQLNQEVLDVYRIEPVGEKRYIEKSAVSLQQPAVHRQISSLPGDVGGQTVTSSGIRERAEQAYQRGCQTGDFAEARRLYQELSRSPDSPTRWEALNRLEFISLRERNWTQNDSRGLSARPTTHGDARQTASTTPNLVAPNDQYAWKPTRTVSTSHSSFAYRIFGVLRRSALTERGQPLFYVEDHLGRLRCYVQVQNASEAERWLNHAVEITAQHRAYRGDLRAELVRAVTIRGLE